MRDGRRYVLDAPGDVLAGRPYEIPCPECNPEGVHAQQILETVNQHQVDAIKEVVMLATDWEIVHAMEVYGGSFVKALAECCHKADAENLARIKATWPEYWREYEEVVRLRKEM